MWKISDIIYPFKPSVELLEQDAANGKDREEEHCHLKNDDGDVSEHNNGDLCYKLAVKKGKRVVNVFIVVFNKCLCSKLTFEVELVRKNEKSL